MKYLHLLLCIWLPTFLFAHGYDEINVKIKSGSLWLGGSLTTPGHTTGKIPLAIIIAGSGPTDRNCNGQTFQTDAYLKLATELAKQGIACYRYDKRGIGESTDSTIQEADVNFQNMIQDARAVIKYFEQDKRFGKITVIGHSEGSLVGMYAVNKNNQYVSLAGVADHAADIIKMQIHGQVGDQENVINQKLDTLSMGKKVVCGESPIMQMLFRPSVQPYLISWFALNPAQKIANLSCPVLIINGTKDLQVDVEQAKKLHAAKSAAELAIITDMNHCLTNIASNENDENLASYQNKALPISPQLIEKLVAFIKK